MWRRVRRGRRGRRRTQSSCTSQRGRNRSGRIRTVTTLCFVMHFFGSNLGTMLLKGWVGGEGVKVWAEGEGKGGVKGLSSRAEGRERVRGEYGFMKLMK